MLAIAPDGVRPDRLSGADDPDRTCGCVFAHPVNRTSVNGVTGTPSLATAEKGAQWFDWLVEDLAALVRKGSAETPPLDHSYSGDAVPARNR
jgi:creatinine amidohydrolase